MTSVSDGLVDKLAAAYRTIDAELSAEKTSVSAEKTIYLNRIITQGQRSMKASHTIIASIGLLWNSNHSNLERIELAMAKIHSGLRVGSSVLSAICVVSAYVMSSTAGTNETQVIIRHLPQSCGGQGIMLAGNTCT
eukprot:6225900-Amphidinium_carterae.1